MNHSLRITHLLGSLFIAAQFAFSQGGLRNEGELNVKFEQGFSGWITVTAMSEVYGDSALWYPQVSGWNSYYVYSTFSGRHQENRNA